MAVTVASRPLAAMLCDHCADIDVTDAIAIRKTERLLIGNMPKNAPDCPPICVRLPCRRG